MKGSVKFWLGPSLALLFASTSLASQLEDPAKLPSLTYQVRAGDTLISLANAYLNRPDDYRQVQKLNGVSEPRRLRVGQSLSLPVYLLRADPVAAEVVNFQGQITIDAGSGPRVLSARQAVTEGAVISTDRNAFVRLSLTDGSHIVIPSNSRVRLTRLRRFVINGALDHNIEVQRGRLENRVAPRRTPGNYRITTPVSVSAVRGTDFRISVNDAADRASTEVLEGEVAVDSLTDGADDQGLVLASANQAVAVGAAGLVRAALLPAPRLVSPDTILTDDQVRVALAPQDGAVRYRGRLARDAGMVETFAEADTEAGETDLNLGALSDGLYYLRVTAISEDGVEGQPTTYNIVRIGDRRHQVGGHSLANPLRRLYHFRWDAAVPRQEGADSDVTYHFVLHRLNAKGEPEAVPVLDRYDITQPFVSLIGLNKGVYSWQVQAVHEGSTGPEDAWSHPQALHIGQ